MRESVIDYTAILIKRERTKSGLGDYEYMAAKIRNRKMEGDQIKTPLSVYLKFLKPKNIEGREVLWIEGQNNNKLRAHEGGIIPIPAVWLDPDGALADRVERLRESAALDAVPRGVDPNARAGDRRHAPDSRCVACLMLAMSAAESPANASSEVVDARITSVAPVVCVRPSAWPIS